MATVLILEGKANDLLSVDNERNLKMTRFVHAGEEDPEYQEIVDIAITSVDPSRTHPFFNNQILGKKIKVIVEAED